MKQTGVELSLVRSGIYKCMQNIAFRLSTGASSDSNFTFVWPTFELERQRQSTLWVLTSHATPEWSGAIHALHHKSERYKQLLFFVMFILGKVFIITTTLFHLGKVILHYP